MALLTSQVKETVIAYLVPLVTLSTWCTFSAPDVKIATRPFRGSNVTLLVGFSTGPSKNTRRPPLKSIP